MNLWFRFGLGWCVVALLAGCTTQTITQSKRTREWRLGTLMVDGHQAEVDLRLQGNILSVVIGIVKQFDSLMAPPAKTPNSRFRLTVGLAKDHRMEGPFRPSIGLAKAGWIL